MKFIERGSDLILPLYLTDWNWDKLEASTSNCTFKVFTQNMQDYIEKSTGDVYTKARNSYLCISADELSSLEDGIISYTYNLIKPTSKLDIQNGITYPFSDDGRYNLVRTVSTDYYLTDSRVCTSNINIAEDVVRSLRNSIDTEKDRAANEENNLKNQISELQKEIEALKSAKTK